jgi:hypothetical protein
MKLYAESYTDLLAGIPTEPSTTTCLTTLERPLHYFNEYNPSLQTDPNDDDAMSGVTPIEDEDDSTHVTVNDKDAEQMRLAMAVTTNAVALGPPCSKASNVGDVRSYIEMATAPAAATALPVAETSAASVEIATEPLRCFVLLPPATPTTSAARVRSTPTTVALGTRTPTSVLCCTFCNAVCRDKCNVGFQGDRFRSKEIPAVELI